MMLVSQALENRSCEISFQPGAPDDGLYGAAADFPRMKLAVKGQGCPIQIVLEMNVMGVETEVCKQTDNATICKFIGSVKMTYAVLEPKLSQDLGVRNGSINMQFNMDQGLPGDGQDGQISDFNMSMKGKASIDLKAVDVNGVAQLIIGSQNFAMVMKMSGPAPGGNPGMNNRMNGQMNETLRYREQSSGRASEFLAVARFAGDKGVETYQIDGNEVSREVYAKERDAFSNSMIEISNSAN
jgi:hypothetical protein